MENGFEIVNPIVEHRQRFPAETTPLFTLRTIALLPPKAPVKYLEVSLFPRTPDPKQILFVTTYSQSFDSTNLPRANPIPVHPITQHTRPRNPNHHHVSPKRQMHL